MKTKLNFLDALKFFYLKHKVKPGEYMELYDEDKKVKGLLLIHKKELTQKFSENLMNSNYNNNSGTNKIITNVVLENMGPFSTILYGYLNAGNLLQIVGSPMLIEGIKNGTHVILQSSGALTGVVSTVSTGKIAGQLLFSPANMLPVLAPIAIWKVINMIAGTYNLYLINQRLDLMQKSLQKIISRQEANVQGSIRSVIRTLKEIKAQYDTLGRFTQDMVIRLSIATQEIQKSFYEQEEIVTKFKEKCKLIKNKIKDKDNKDVAEMANNLIKDEGAQYYIDAERYINLLNHYTLASYEWLLYDLEVNPQFAYIRLENTMNEIESIEPIKILMELKELQDNAKECLKKFNWFDELIYRKNIKAEIEDRQELFDKHFNNSEDNNQEQSFFIYKDKNDIKIVLADQQIEIKEALPNKA